PSAEQRPGSRIPEYTLRNPPEYTPIILAKQRGIDIQGIVALMRGPGWWIPPPTVLDQIRHRLHRIMVTVVPLPSLEKISNSSTNLRTKTEAHFCSPTVLLSIYR